MREKGKRADIGEDSLRPRNRFDNRFMKKEGEGVRIG